jgi:hypothetical protein
MIAPVSIRVPPFRPTAPAPARPAAGTEAALSIATTDVWNPTTDPTLPNEPAPPADGPTLPRDGFKESLVGSALHTTGAAAIAGGIGFLVGGPFGAAVGAGIGAAAAQGFMQLLTRFADGGKPVAAALPGLAAGAGALAGGLIWGAGAAAWGLILAPLALTGGYLLVRRQLEKITY